MLRQHGAGFAISLVKRRYNETAGVKALCIIIDGTVFGHSF